MKQSDLSNPVALAKIIAASNSNNIPVNATGSSYASQTEGFPEITMIPEEQGGEAPHGKDFNGFLRILTSHMFNIQNGTPETFNPEVSALIGGYPKNAQLWLINTTTSRLLKSTKDDNTDNFLTTPSVIGTSWIDAFPTKDYVDNKDTNLQSQITTNANNIAIKANNNAVVHLSGNETITGAKTITTTWTIGSGNPVLRFQNTDVVKGTTPAASESANITVYDNESNSATASRLGQFFVQYGNDGRIGTVLRVYQPVHGSTTYSDLGIYYPPTGSAYTFAPIPTDTTSTTSRQIATVGWANSSVSHLLHKIYDEVVNGIKTFTTRIRVANGMTTYNNNITKGTAPTSSQYNGVACYDGSGTYEDTHLLGKHEVFIATDGNVNTNMTACKNEANSTASARLRVLYEKTSNSYFAQFYGVSTGSDTNNSLTKATSSTTDNTIPCMGWVNNPAASTNVVHILKETLLQKTE